MKRILVAGLIAALCIVVAPAMAITYPDQTLSGGFQAGHFPDVWDLTAGDITLSFTYDGTGLVDDFGGSAHAWSELGVRSVTWAPKTLDLLAGQTIDAGDVIVTREGDILTVTYKTTDGWAMTETHLAVSAGDLSGIPMTKKGIPIPGQFLYSTKHDPPVMEFPVTIDLSGWDVKDPLYIAAHASLIKAIDGCEDTVWMVGDVEAVVTCDGNTYLSNYADEFNMMGGSECALANGYTPYQAPVFADPFIVDVNSADQFPFMSDYAPVHNPVDPTTKGTERYGTDFDVQWTGGLPFGGILTLSWSPGQSAIETKRITGDGISPAVFIATGTPSPGAGWFLDKYPLVENSVNVGPLAAGEHLVRFEHTTGDGTFWDWVKLERPCVRYETGWAAGTEFTSTNWATYFTYSTAGPEAGPDFNPTWMAEGSGVWLATDYESAQNTFDPDPPGAPTQDIDDKLILQKGGGMDEGYYNLPSVPPNPWANHAVWFDRDGVDPSQAQMWGAIDGVTYNTEGTYEVEINLHATSDTAGEVFMTVNGESQGFYVPNWHAGPADLMPAGMTFTGDMKHLQVFYGLYGYGATHSVSFSEITVEQ